MGKNFWIDIGPKHCLLCADTCRWGRHPLGFRWPHGRHTNCPVYASHCTEVSMLSLTQSHSLGVQMLSSQASQGLSEDLVTLDGGRTAALLDGLSARYGLPAPWL